MWTPGRRLCFPALALMLIAQVVPAAHATAAKTVSEFKLANGLTVVVVPDNRAPVVTLSLIHI